VAKAPDAFRTISEAAEEVGVPQHVLRFWETRFPFVTPLKRAGGRRFYRPQDLAVLRGLKRLLHDEGVTIRGVQRLHKTRGMKAITEDVAFEAAPNPAREASGDVALMASVHVPGLAAALVRIEAAKARLDRALQA